MRPSSKLLRSSSFRLGLIYMALFGTSVLMLLGFLYWSTDRYVTTQVREAIEDDSDELLQVYNRDGLIALRRRIRERHERPWGRSSLYLLADRAGTRVEGNISGWPVGAESFGAGWISFILGDAEDDRQAHRARARVDPLDDGYRLLVGRETDHMREMRRMIIQALAWGLVITVVLSLVGGTMMSRTTVRRLESINRTARDIMTGDLSRRIPTHDSGDDFDELAENLNRMLDRIQMLMEGVRQVSDNIAHDLRTPLARLKNRLELAQRQRPGSDEAREIVEQAVLEADGLLSTFNALLRIARIEVGSRKEGFGTVDLSSMAHDVVELYEPLAEDRDQTLEAHIDDGIRIKGDGDLLFQALANLLDNAVKYTPEGGEIRLEVQRTGAGPRIRVCDNGPGIPADLRDRVFQRFYRLEASRSSPGNGLGLSLVDAVAHLHGARIGLSDADPGLCVTLALPADARISHSR